MAGKSGAESRKGGAGKKRSWDNRTRRLGRREGNAPASEKAKAQSAKTKRTRKQDESAKTRTEKLGRIKTALGDEEPLLRLHGLTPTNSRSLGEGSYGYVRKATRNSDGLVVAVKVINRTKASSRFLKTFLPRELTLTTSLSHPNLVACYSHFENERYTCLVMELMAKGDLEQHISLHGAFRDKDEPGDEFRVVMRGILSGVAYLHSKDVAHRDLKLENVLLGPGMVAKIADMGYARVMKGEVLSKTFCGSKAYAAPEILNQTPYKGSLADCWSLGIILYVCLAAAFPFDDRNQARQMKAQTESALDLNSRKFKPQSALLIRAFLSPAPVSRISASDALRHPALNPSRLPMTLQSPRPS